MNEEYKRLVRLLQEEFPVCERPFEQLAARLGTTQEHVMEMTRRLQEEGKLRRITVSLFHVHAGFRVNSMLVWDVPEERLDRAAREAAKLDQVTHCYVRQRREEFDYNLYTMVHETSRERFDALLEQLKAMIDPVKFCDLRTSRELKKTGMKYFV